LLRKPKLAAIARRLGATSARVALRWLLRLPDIIAIPESADQTHVRDNRVAAALRLDSAALRELDAAFPPPTGATPLGML
jgi:diketogulonate reductase-like aldo/keto reductase